VKVSEGPPGDSTHPFPKPDRSRTIRYTERSSTFLVTCDSQLHEYRPVPPPPTEIIRYCTRTVLAKAPKQAVNSSVLHIADRHSRSTKWSSAFALGRFDRPLHKSSVIRASSASGWCIISNWSSNGRSSDRGSVAPLTHGWGYGPRLAGNARCSTSEVYHSRDAATHRAPWASITENHSHPSYLQRIMDEITNASLPANPAPDASPGEDKHTGEIELAHTSDLSVVGENGEVLDAKWSALREGANKAEEYEHSLSFWASVKEYKAVRTTIVHRSHEVWLPLNGQACFWAFVASLSIIMEGESNLAIRD
jgi:hypothetical protein